MVDARQPSAAMTRALLGMTVVTGLVDAVSFLSLGRVFTANMTGNVVILGFATAGVPGVSVARSLTALLAFIGGAAVGGRILAGVGSDRVFATFAIEGVRLAPATPSAIAYQESSPESRQLYSHCHIRSRT